MRIDGTTSTGATPLPSATPGQGKTANFEELLRSTLGDANHLQAKAESSIQALATGKDIDPATVVNAVNQADLAVRTMIQIRNRLVEAFNELRQLQI